MPEQIDPALWSRPDLQPMLATHDITALLRVLREVGLGQRLIADLTGRSQSRISEMAAGRRVMFYDVLVSISKGLGIPPERMGLSWWGPDGKWYGPDGAYDGREAPQSGVVREVDDEMFRRDLLAQGSITLYGLTWAGKPVLGALLGVDGGPGASTLPSRVGMGDVAEIEASTEQLREASRTRGGQSPAALAIASEYSRLMEVPAASDAVAARRGAALAALWEVTGVCCVDSGDDRSARWCYREAVTLAREVGNKPRVAGALEYAAILDAARDHPEYAVKLWQVALELQRAAGDTREVAWMQSHIAFGMAKMGHNGAVEQLTRARDGFAAVNKFDQADWDYQSAVIYWLAGRLDTAEAFTAQVGATGWVRPVGILAGVLRATIHVQTCEPRGLTMADQAIQSVAALRSRRAREKLAPLATALEARPGSDAQELARMARQVAA